MKAAVTATQTAISMIMIIALSFAFFAAEARCGENDTMDIRIHLGAGINIIGGKIGRPAAFVFKAEVFPSSTGESPFDTVHIETPRGDLLEFEACEEETCFVLLEEYENARQFNHNFGNIGGEYTFVFNKDTAAEDTLTIVYPHNAFPDYFADVLHPEHEDLFAPLQMVVKWELVPQWREYYNIVVELEDFLTGDILFASDLLPSRQTSLDLEKEYGILETDMEMYLTVRLLRKEEGETATQSGAVARYTTTQFTANEINFVTTPDYYIGNSSDGTTCFIQNAVYGR